jgi:signal transduction histidine kinase
MTPKTKKLSLSGKLIAVEALITVIILCWYSWRVGEVNSQAVEDNLHEISIASHKVISAMYYSASDMMSYLGHQLTDSQVYRNYDKIANKLKYFQNHNYGTMFKWCSADWADKFVNYRVDSDLGIMSKPYRDLSHVKTIIDAHEKPGVLHLGSADHRITNQRGLVMVAMGYEDKKGDFMGALFGLISLRDLAGKIMADIKLTSEISFIVGDNHGIPLLEYGNMGSIRKYTSKFEEFIYSKKSSKSILPSFFSTNKEAVIFKKFDKYPFSLLAIVHDAYNYKDILIDYKRVLMDILMIFMVTMSVLWFIRSRFLTPIALLAKQANKIANNEDKINIPEYNTREMAMLANSLKKVMEQQIELKETSKKLDFMIDKVRSSNNIKTDFLKRMQHEFRTPLNHIVGSVGILKSACKDSDVPNVQEYLEMIDHSTMELMEKYNDILAISDYKSGTIQLVEKVHTIKSLVEQTVAELAPKAQEKHINIQVDISNNVPKAYIDFEKMKNALANILDNAVEFSLMYGKVKVAVERINSGVTIEISDNGVGIKKEDLELIKEIFSYSGDALKKSSDSGIGLGMAIAVSIFDLHGVKLNVKSTEGKGTKVKVNIPNIRLR